MSRGREGSSGPRTAGKLSRTKTKARSTWRPSGPRGREEGGEQRGPTPGAGALPGAVPVWARWREPRAESRGQRRGEGGRARRARRAAGVWLPARRTGGRGRDSPQHIPAAGRCAGGRMEAWPAGSAGGEALQTGRGDGGVTLARGRLGARGAVLGPRCGRSGCSVRGRRAAARRGAGVGSERRQPGRESPERQGPAALRACSASRQGPRVPET